MPAAETSPDYKARQSESVWQFKLTPATDARVQEHAKANNQSVSEVIREAIHVWVTGNIPPVRQRRTRRRSAWINPAEYVLFKKKAEANELQQIEALEAALEEIL